MNADEDRRYILNEFLSIIFGISDINYQKRVWIRGEGPECDDFTETVCHFFDDGDPILKRYKEYNISEKQYELLVQFRKKFENFVDGDRPYLPEEFIETPEWRQIMNLAKDVLKAFEYQKR